MPGKYSFSPYPQPPHTHFLQPPPQHPAPTRPSQAVSGSALPRAPGSCPCPQKAHRPRSTTHPITGAPRPTAWCCLLLLVPTESNQVPQLDDALGPPNTQKNVRLVGSSPFLAPSKVLRSYLPLSTYLSLRCPPTAPHPPYQLQPSISDPSAHLHVGSLTSDPGVPLPTRGCTFCPKQGFPSSLAGRLPPLTQGLPSQSDAFPPDQGRELPTVTTSTLTQGLPLSTLVTSVLTKGRSLATVTFSTLSQDPLSCPQRGVLLLTLGSPSPTMGSSSSDPKSLPS